MRALAYADPVDDDTTPQIAKVEYPPAEDDPDPVIAKVEPDDPDVAIAKVEFPPTRPEEPDPVIKSVQYVAKRSPKDVALPAEPKKVVLPRLSTPAERTTWEKRADGTEKGDGYFGVLTRPDGRVSSELSIGVNLDGKDTEIPSLVPTLSRSEVLSLLALDPEKDQTPQSIIDKAVAFARTRKQQGLPYFAQHGEQQGVDLPGVYDTPNPAPRQTFDAYGRPITAPTNAAAQAQTTADRAVKWLSTPTDTSKWPTTANRPISEIAMQFADIARDAELEGAQTTLAGAKRVLGGVQRLSQLAAQTGRSVGQAVGIALPPVAPSPRITPDIPATIGAVVPAKVAPTDPRIGPGTIDRSPEATAARQRLQDLPPPSMFDAATDIVGGALQAGTIPLGLLGLDSPIKMALALGLGSGAEHLADVTAEELKIRPDIARFMKTVAGLAGGVAGFEGPEVVRGFGERAATVAGGEARAFAALGLTPHDVAGKTQDEAAQVVTDAFRERAEPLADAVAAGAKGAKLPPAVTQQVGDLYHAYLWFSETSPAMQKAAPRIVQILSDFGLKPTNAVDEAAPVASTAPRIAQQAGLGTEPAGDTPTQTPDGQDVVGQAPVAPETYASPAAPPPVVEPATPQVPFMITRQMAADLRARGIDEQAIGRMTPKEAWDILQTPAPDRIIKPGVPIAVNMPREEPIAPEPETAAQFVERTTQPAPPAGMTRQDAVQWARTQAHAEGKTGDEYDQAVDAYLAKAGQTPRSAVRGPDDHLVTQVKQDLRGQPEAPVQPVPPIASVPRVATAAEAAEGQFYVMPPSVLSTDPDRLQFKADVNAKGVTPRDRIEGPWNPNMAGVVLAWKDPADGKLYVVNGHHRLDAATRLGAPQILVKVLEPMSVDAARLEGALANIGDDKGTPIDAAKVIKGGNYTPQELQQRVGLDPRKKVARDGFALAQLADPIFHRVTMGEIDEPIGVAIGQAGLSHAGQEAVVKLTERQRLRDKEVTPNVLKRFIDMAQGGQDVKASESQRDIFADVLGEDKAANTAVTQAELAEWASSIFGKDKHLFRYVADAARAARLAEGGSAIDIEAAKKIGGDAAQVKNYFDKLANKRGPVNQALRDAAIRIEEGEPIHAVKAALLPALRQAVADEIGPAAGGGVQTAGGRGESLPVGEDADRAGDRGPDGGPDTLFQAGDGRVDPSHPAIEFTKKVYQNALKRGDGQYADHVLSFLRRLERPDQPVGGNDVATYSVPGMAGSQLVWYNKDTGQPSAIIDIVRNNDADPDGGRYYAARIAKELAPDPYRDERFKDPRDQLKDGTVSLAFTADWNYLGLPPQNVDVLEHGEFQPRLPGDVGAVRDQEIAQPKLADQPIQSYSPANLKAAFHLTDDQAVAVHAIVEAMGLDTDRIKIAFGGTTGASDALFQKQTQTDAFKQWFTGSRVVDKDGNPLRAYHGTRTQFDAFKPAPEKPHLKRTPWAGDLGSWFTAPSTNDIEYEHGDQFDPGNAEFMAGDFAMGSGSPIGAHTVPVYLAIKNPAEFEGFDDFDDQRNGRSGTEFRKALEAKGHDGAVIRSSMTDGDVVRDDWIAFTPEQVKSAIGNRGTFDPKDARILYQTNDPTKISKWYYSNIEQALATWQSKGTPEQFLAHLAKFKGATEEAATIQLKQGLEDLVDGTTGTVTRDEIQHLLNGRQIDVQEVVRGDFSQYVPNTLTGEPTKFHHYQVPGGTNYREILLTLPTEAESGTPDRYRDLPPDSLPYEQFQADHPALAQALDDDLYYYAGRRLDPQELKVEFNNVLYSGEEGNNRVDAPTARAIASAYPDAVEAWRQYKNRQNVRQAALKKTFTSGHWDEPNVLAHIRVNDREANGKKTLFVEEIQSDWHQRGRKMGYLGDADKQIAALKDEEAKIRGDMRLVRDVSQVERLAAITTELRGLQVKSAGAVPEAPFKGNAWKKLALKRVLAYASEHGYDAIAWTTGEQQNARYDLSKHISKLSYVPYEVSDGGGVLQAWDTNNRLVVDKDINSDADLADHVGKDVAEKLLAAPATSKVRSLSGLDLKIGGTGMVGFYDRELPNLMNDLVKKYGQKVGRQSLTTARFGADIDREMLGGKGPKQTADVHSLSLTPEMRADITQKGLPLFQDLKGAVEFTEDGKAILRGIQNPDLSTALHELLHAGRRQLVNKAVPAEARRGITDADIDAVEAWAGVKDGVWTREAEEKYARAGERFLYEGRAPTPKLQTIFGKIRKWMMEVYRTLKGSAIDIDIPANINQFFERLFSRAERNKVADQAAADRAGVKTDRYAEMVAERKATTKPKAQDLDFGAGPNLLFQKDDGAQPTRDELLDLVKRVRGYVQEGLTHAEAKQAYLADAKSGPDMGQAFDVAWGRLGGKPPEPTAFGGGSAPPSWGPPPANEPPPSEPEGPPKRAGNINLSKFDLPDEAKAELKRIIDQNNEYMSQRRGVRSWDTTEAVAAAIPIPKKVGKAGKAMNAEELESLGGHIMATRQQLDEVNKQVAAGNADISLLAKQAQLLAQEQVLLEVYAGGIAEAGRALNILRKMRHAIQTKDQRLLDAAVKFAGGRDQLEGIAKRLAPFDENDLIGKYRFIRSLQQVGVADWLSWYWYTNLLSGPLTHARNLIGNTSNLAFTLASKPASAAVDAGRALATNSPRAVRLGEMGAEWAGLRQGWMDGIMKAGFLMRHGFTMDDLSSSEFRPPEVPGGMATNFIGRALEASDMISRSVRAMSELYAQAYTAAKNAGHTKGTTEWNRFVTAFIANPPRAAMAGVAREASRSVFRQAPTHLISQLERTRDNWKMTLPSGRTIRVFNPVKFIIPFVRTPANIMKSSLEASPLGLVSAPFNKESSRERSEAAGRALTGTLLLAPLAMLVAQGLVSGSGPNDKELKDELYRRGWQPNSIRIGNTWYNYSNIQPIALPLSILANAFESYQLTGKAPDVSVMLAKTANSVLQQSYLSGIAALQDALEDPERWGAAFAQKLATSLMPMSSARGQIARAIDPVIRQPATIGESLKAGQPFASEGVRGRLDAFGEQSKRGGSVLSRLFSPAAMSDVKDTPLEDELYRLRNDIQIGFPSKTVTIQRKTVSLTPDEYDELLSKSGQQIKTALTRRIRASDWRATPDEMKARIIQNIVNAERAQVRAQVLVKVRARLK